MHATATETDFVLPSSRVAALTALVVCATHPERRTVLSPLSGRPLAQIP